MAAFVTQLQPFEENQSPSPVDEIDNPYESALARNTSSSSRHTSTSPTVQRSNTLHSQLAGDPEPSPPAWKRRTSITTPQKSSSPIRSPRSPNDPPVSSPLSPTPSNHRRHPSLTMTTTMRPPVPGGMFMHESPNASSTSLNDQGLALPQPFFRRRTGGGGSNRSSIHSQDLSSLTSEELWNIESGGGMIADMNNPDRNAMERPLDTVRRMSRLVDKQQGFNTGLPGDVIWPAAPPMEEIYNPPPVSRSVTSMSSLKNTPKMSRRKTSRQQSLDISQTQNKLPEPVYPKSQPASPGMYPKPDGMISSAHSSSVSLKSHPGLSRPPSAYYSRDFLSSLAPREGGYAIAAQMGNGLGAVGTMSVEERRKSMIFDEQPKRQSRAPVSRSAGMGRWSLDGGEHYNKPYGSASANTTSSNLSVQPVYSPDPSPPTDDGRSSYLPDGAAPSQSNTRPASLDTPPPPLPITQTPSPLSQNISPHPLSQETTPSELAPTPTATTPQVTPKKSKKQLAKEAKAAEKAELVKVSKARAEAARNAELKRQADKVELKRKEKEEKERKKREKKEGKLKSASLTKLSGKGGAVKEEVPPVPAMPAQLPERQPVSEGAAGGLPFPRSSQSAYKVRPTEEIRPTRSSMPASSVLSTPQTQTQTQSRAKLGMLGTIKKRLSIFGGDELAQSGMGERSGKTNSPGSGSSGSLPPVPATPPRSEWSSTKGDDVVVIPASSAPLESEMTPITPPLEAVKPLSDLPPRSSSRTPPINDVSHLPTLLHPAQEVYSNSNIGTSNPLPIPIVQTPSRPTSIPTALAGSPLSKSLSNDNHSPGSSLRLKGPRPMPNRSPEPSRSRAASVATHSSHTHTSAGLPSQATDVTPSTTSGESGLGMGIGSGMGSEKSSVTSCGDAGPGLGLERPEREESGDTIKGGMTLGGPVGGLVGAN